MTRNSELLAYAATDLDTIRPLLDDALERLNDQRRGQPGSTFGGSGGPSGNTSPVEKALGLNTTGGSSITPDQAARRITEIDQAIGRIVRDLRLVAVIVTGEAGHAAPTDKDRREAERSNTDEVPWCDHCVPHRGPKALERLADKLEVYRSGTVNKNIPVPLALCRWCYEAVLYRGGLPSRSEIQQDARTTDRPVRRAG